MKTAENETELVFKLSKTPTQLLSGTELKLSVSFYSQTFINCLRNIRRNKDRTRTKDQRIIFYSDKKIVILSDPVRH